MGSSAHMVFDANVSAVETLTVIHELVRPGKAGRGGRPYAGTEVLHEAAVLLLTSCWEVYIEDVCREAFNFIIRAAEAPNRVPTKPRKRVADALKADKNDLRVWDLAGDGWRQVLEAYRDEITEAWTGNWNTPKSGQVTALVSDLLGINDITRYWKWHRMTPRTAATTLDALVTLRGDIAHRGPELGRLRKADVTRHLNHVKRLVDATDDAIAWEVQTSARRLPWDASSPQPLATEGSRKVAGRPWR